MTNAKATAWAAAVVAATGTVSAFRLAAVSALWDALDAVPVTNIDNMWLHRFAGNQIAAKVSITSGNLIAVPVGGPVWTDAGGYFTTNTAYVNLQTPGGPSYVQDSATIGVVKLSDNPLANLTSMGSVRTTGQGLCDMFLKNGDGGMYCGLNGGGVTFGTGAPAATTGTFMVQRVAASGAGAVQVYKDNVSLFTWTAVVSDAVPNQNFCLGGMFDSAGVFGNGGAAAEVQQFGACWLGGATAAQNGAIVTALANYFSLGADPGTAESSYFMRRRRNR